MKPPIEILLSQLGGHREAFEKDVSDHIAALEAHSHTEGKAAPSAHPLVEAVVARIQHPVEAMHQPERTYQKEVDGELVTVTEPYGDPIPFVSSDQPDSFVANYKIVDDLPPPPTLDERKAKLADDLTHQAQKIIDTLVPPLKRGFWDIQYSEAVTVDPPTLRTADQKATVERHEARNTKVRAVYRHLAQMHSAIHDLTDETFDGWSPSPWPTFTAP